MKYNGSSWVIGGGSGNYADGSLNVLFAGNNIISFSYSSASCNAPAKDVPPDFTTLYNSYNNANNAAISANQGIDLSNFISALFLGLGGFQSNVPVGPIPQPYPEQTLNMFAVSYGKVFFLRTPCVRVIVKGGIAAGTVTTPTDFVKQSYSLNNTLYNYYSYSYQQKAVIGLVANPVLELATGRWFGLSVGPYANLNAQYSLYGIEASMMFGKIRCRKADYNRNNYYRSKYY